jgi:hypothetical protein
MRGVYRRMMWPIGENDKYIGEKRGPIGENYEYIGENLHFAAENLSYQVGNGNTGEESFSSTKRNLPNAITYKNDAKQDFLHWKPCFVVEESIHDYRLFQHHY